MLFPRHFQERPEALIKTDSVADLKNMYQYVPDNIHWSSSSAFFLADFKHVLVYCSLFLIKLQAPSLGLY